MVALRVVAGVTLLVGTMLGAPAIAQTQGTTQGTAQGATQATTSAPLKLGKYMKPAKSARTAKPLTKPTSTATTAAANTTGAATAAQTTERKARTGSAKVWKKKKTSRRQARTVAAVVPRPKDPPTEATETTGASSSPLELIPIAPRANRVRVMSFNVLNEIDIAADAPAAGEPGPDQPVTAEAATTESVESSASHPDVATSFGTASEPQHVETVHAQAFPATFTGTRGDAEETTWLRSIVIAFGGLLAAASAIRMFVG